MSWGDIALHDVEGRTVVALRGEVDLDAVLRFRAEGPRADVVDVVASDELTFLDSSGLKFLLELTSRNPELVLVDPAPALTELLEMTNTAQLFRTRTGPVRSGGADG
ncbi:STAS domain-containing protein [Georgenia sp. 10Sc9-8]|uniref:STAS domain-containing protein n=1 Tax=Georgenia halotolerans TaxID=3028317 RepID=A0ABT5TVR5_9MICO|nr:STAS domain-containing protein [Georgenia halotolerans]